MLNLTAVNSDSWERLMPRSWRYVRTPPASGAYNMAVDTAMMSVAREHNIGVWRCYRWDQPTISFGRNERVHTQFDEASIHAANMQAVRRPTGGRALLHSDEVTYSVAVPVSDTLAWREVYQAVNAVLVRALRSLGVPVEMVESSDSALLKPDGPVCFDQPAPGELTVAGAKLVGSAVWRERGAFLQHGSILLHDTQHRLHDAMRETAAVSHVTPDATPEPTSGTPRATRTRAIPAAASLATCLPVTPQWDDVAKALEQALSTFVTTAGGVSSPLETPLWPTDELPTLEMHYSNRDWLWRR